MTYNQIKKNKYKGDYLMVKRKRRVLAVIIAVSMVFSSAGFTFAEDNLDNVSTEKPTVTEEIKKEEPQKEEVKQEEPKKEEIKQEEPKKEEEPQVKEENKQEGEVSNQKTETKSRNVKSAEEPQVKEEKEENQELSITFKYIDKDTKDWTEKVITDPHDNWTVTINKANNVIANHKTVTIGLEVNTFTKWDTDFPITLDKEHPTAFVTAEYKTEKKPQLTFKYTDNISTGSGSWQNQSPNETYTHTFKNPLIASPRSNYTFLYWENVKDSSETYTAGKKYKCDSRTLDADKTVEFVAVYSYQPEVELYYYKHYDNENIFLKDSGPKTKPINIYKDSQAPKSIKYWFYDEEGGNPIPNGELISLPNALSPIKTEPAKEDQIKKVNVYAHYYGVTFVDDDGESVLKAREAYQYDTDADDIEKPEDPTKEPTAQYTFFFDGWFPTIVNVIEEAIYQATYRSEVNKYTVTWVNDDGTQLELDEEVPYGDMPSYDGETPTKKSTPQYTYEFKGWTPAVSEVTGDITYTAEYNAIVNQYTVKFVDEDGTELSSKKYDYGATPIYEGDTPVKASTDKYSYEFDSWTPEISEVTEDAVYTATYKATIRKYTVTYKPGT